MGAKMMPELRRRLTVSFHWSLLILTMLLVGGVAAPLVAWLFVLVSFAMTALAILFGLQAKPGPLLDGVVRQAHPWLHRALYAYLLLTAWLTAVNQIFGQRFDLHGMYLVLIWAALFHGMFHLWRHTALGDGCLRNMTPKFLHKNL